MYNNRIYLYLLPFHATKIPDILALPCSKITIIRIRYMYTFSKKKKIKMFILQRVVYVFLFRTETRSLSRRNRRKKLGSFFSQNELKQKSNSQ